MKLQSKFLIFLLLPVALSSCEFQCRVGEADKKQKAEALPEKKEDAIIYNGILMKANKVNVNRAYLVENLTGDKVPNDNFVSFRQPIKLVLLINDGWKEEDGRVYLGVSEKIVDEDGDVILDKADLFENYTDGVSADDAKIIGITANILLPENSPPTRFKVYFRAWDKKGDGSIEGSYTLYSK